MEALRKISDEPLLECPSCGKPELKKKVSAAAFRLKGGGWYETDFKTGDKKNIAGEKTISSGSDSSASDSSASTSASASDSSSSSSSTSKSDSSSSSSSNPAAAS
jgi:putative FmdB family regulatory protein